MNTNLTTNDMNIEDYEDQAIKKSKIAKGIGIAAAGAVGGAAIAAGTAYATGINGKDVLDEPLNAEEMAKGAEVGEEFQPVEETPAQPTTQYVYVEKPEPEPEIEVENEPEVTWDETTEYYIGDEQVLKTEEGTIDGHNFMIADVDADGKADVLAYDLNNNKEYEENEIVELKSTDNIYMGNQTAHTTAKHYEDPYADPWNPGLAEGQQPYAYNEQPSHQIHNNFEDEKTGEEYHGDFAEGNPDYNPRADVDYGSNEQYLAENYSYDGGDNGSYHAGISEVETEENVASQPDLAEASEAGDDSFDSMMESEEFLG